VHSPSSAELTDTALTTASAAAAAAANTTTKFKTQGWGGIQ